MSKKYSYPEYRRAWRKKNRHREHNAYLYHTYGLTLIDYDAMLKAQDGVCAICRRPPMRRRLDVDHDHQHGFVRGLLCSQCNRALHYVERLGWLEAAQNYLTLKPRGSMKK